MTNLPIPAKKGSASWSAKPKTAKKGEDSFETCSDIVPFEGGLPPIGSIVLESSLPPSAHTRSSRRPTTSKSRLAALRLYTDAPSFSRTRGNKRKTSPPPLSATSEKRVCYL